MAPSGPGNRMVGNHYFAKTDADPDPRLQIIFPGGADFAIVALKCPRGSDCIRCPGKPRHQSITAQLVGNAVVDIDGSGQMLKYILDSLMSK